MEQQATTTDRLAVRLQDRVGRALESGEPGRRARWFLRGEWMGRNHPLHPVMVDTTIGFWSSGMVLDLLHVFGMRGSERAADVLLGMGVASVPVSAASGLTEWSEAEGDARRTGLIHASFNSMATLMFIVSLLLRAKGRRGPGIAASLVGGGLATVGGYLGGKLVFEQGMGVRSSE